MNNNTGAALFLTTGFEEVEALATVDVLRRGGVAVDTVSLTGSRLVTGSHAITVQVDLLFEDASDGHAMLILPGGPGTANYKSLRPFLDYLAEMAADGRYIAAICAAPSVLAELGLLRGRRAVCFAAYEDELRAGGAVIGEGPVVRDGNIITSRAISTALLFGLECLAALAGPEKAREISEKMMMGLPTQY